MALESHNQPVKHEGIDKMIYNNLGMTFHYKYLHFMEQIDKQQQIYQKSNLKNETILK